MLALLAFVLLVACPADRTERCNGIDDDGDGDVDERGADDEPVWFGDADGDGYGEPSNPHRACEMPTGYADNATDCDDGDPQKVDGCVASTW